MSIKSAPSGNGCALAIGNFDGVHLGHRSLIQRLIEMSERLKVPSVVFTFDPPPMKLLKPGFIPRPLTCNERREKLLKQLGVEHVLFYPTTRDLLDYTPRQFFERILVEQLHIRGIVEGPNFLFGKDRTGTVKTLDELSKEHGVEIEVVEPQVVGDRLISSTQIREWIEQGDLRKAKWYLGEPYRLEGMVVQGAARGRTLGFPTANLEGVEVLIPKHGVYAARVVSPVELCGVPVALHIGPNPTFGEDANKIEAHLIGYQGDLYGSRLEIEVLDSVRGVQKFHSKDELLSQLRIDIESVRRLVSRHPESPS